MKIRSWLGLAAALCLSAGLATAVANAQAWKADTSFASPGHSLKTARESLAAGYYTGAVADLSTLISRVPPDAEVYFLLGAAHWGHGNAPEARAALDKALALDPSLTDRLGEYPVGPGNAGRITDATRPQADRAPAVQAPASARPGPAPAQAPRPAATTPAQAGATPAIGTAAYFIRYGRIALEGGDGPGAANYARQALKVDPADPDAQRLLAAALRAPAARPKTCQQIWSSCWVSARDYADKMACNQRDIVCKANER